ncbi:hypothetical protein SLNWT_3934 [Streptomyces albus]|uniref:DUF397 domain-containing protein n=1 Tax=Streptomyces albus (strain ATCC 21838 / DSM 41398 / FERM P-419 / JCM 4703 / NBRC 107858) TaxID=1081613 RepID=A0A0B5EYC1_STRA4|nr:hypothetical protein SLNWT_3934 [Streptomyces albus]AOU78618.1 hypothetical protein SLNHY_3927 [Streptomyces albus]AYN34359.1 DUF397 domain-containing protein [Streptomyces albus]
MSHVEDAASLAVTWWKSSASGAQGDCVEFGVVNGEIVAVRDSKASRGPALLFGRSAVRGLVAGLKDGTLS